MENEALARIYNPYRVIIPKYGLRANLLDFVEVYWVQVRQSVHLLDHELSPKAKIYRCTDLVFTEQGRDNNLSLDQLQYDFGVREKTNTHCRSSSYSRSRKNPTISVA